MIDWEKYGFKKLHSSGYYYENAEDFPLRLDEESDGTLTVYNASDGEYTLSEKRIPATNQSVVLLLKAFAVKREKS